MVIGGHRRSPAERKANAPEQARRREWILGRRPRIVRCRAGASAISAVAISSAAR
ncbi:Hypothetical protein A7982_04698 [Minicystis rosea]|nr:Hypothetical protein A7982_04698 [Minicystis rosea]